MCVYNVNFNFIGTHHTFSKIIAAYSSKVITFPYKTQFYINVPFHSLPSIPTLPFIITTALIIGRYITNAVRKLR